METKSFFFYFEDMKTWPQQHGLTLIPDPAMYMVEKGQRQHIRICNENYELSQKKHTYTCKKCGQQGHSRRNFTVNENN
jgi:uncharacterized paraquat-inducible protein A